MLGYSHECRECGAGIVRTEDGGWIHHETASPLCYPT